MSTTNQSTSVLRTYWPVVTGVAQFGILGLRLVGTYGYVVVRDAVRKIV